MRWRGFPTTSSTCWEPWEPFTWAVFQRMAREAVADIQSRGKLPIIAGGTGFYIQALLYDIDFQETEEVPEIRRELERLGAERGGRLPSPDASGGRPGGPRRPSTPTTRSG